MNVSSSKTAVTRDLSRRLFLGGSLATGGLAALTACSSPTPSTKTSSGKTRLVYWSWLSSTSTDDPRAVAQNQILNAFRAKNPDIDLQEQVVPWNDLQTQFLQAVHTGKAPDVATLPDNTIGTLQSAGALTALDQFVSDWSKDRKNDYAYPWSDLTIVDKKYAFRQALRPGNYMFYRKDLYENARLKPATTKDQFAETVKTLTSGNIAGWIMNFSKADNVGAVVTLLSTMLWDHGTDLINLETSQPIFQQDAGIEAMTWVQDRIYLDHVMPTSVSTMDTTASDQQFLSGNAATDFEATAKYGGWKSKFPGNTLGFAPPPNWANDSSRPAYANLFSGWTLAMSRTANKDAAWKLMDFMQSNEAELIDAKVGGNIPTRKTTMSDTWFESPEASYMQGVLKWLEGNNHGTTTLQIKNYPAFTDALGDAVQTIVALRGDVAKALKAAAQTYSDALK